MTGRGPDCADALNNPMNVAIPTANPKRLTQAHESAVSSLDKRSLHVDLVRLDRTVPAAGCFASRNPGTPSSAERLAAQAEAGCHSATLTALCLLLLTPCFAQCGPYLA